MKHIIAIARELREIGEHENADRLLCAIAALTDGQKPLGDLTYTGIMRDIRKDDIKKVRAFQKSFKKAFDEALEDDIENPEEIALMEAIDTIGYKHD